MGALCSKESDAFAQPGRRLGEAPAQASSAAVPASAKPAPKVVGGPPRTLGGSGGEASSGGDAAADARRRAAAAAEVSFSLTLSYTILHTLPVYLSIMDWGLASMMIAMMVMGVMRIPLLTELAGPRTGKRRRRSQQETG